MDIAKRALEKHAGLSFNERFVFIETQIFYRSKAARHDVGVHSVLPIDCADGELGEAVRKSLEASRMIDIETERHLLSFLEVGKKYEEWVARTLDELGYANRKALFKDMMAVSIDQTPEALTLQPLIHEALEGWGLPDKGTRPDPEKVVVALDVSDTDLGASIRLAMSRCE